MSWDFQRSNDTELSLGVSFFFFANTIFRFFTIDGTYEKSSWFFVVQPLSFPSFAEPFPALFYLHAFHRLPLFLKI